MGPVDGRDVCDNLVYDFFFAHDEGGGEGVDGGGTPRIPSRMLDRGKYDGAGEDDLELLKPFVTGFSSSFGNAYV